MLKLSEISLKKNLLLVEEYPLDITTQTASGIHKSEDQLNEERARRRFRIGKLIDSGELDATLVRESGLKYTEGEPIEEQDVLYTADAVELVDIPVEGTTRLLLVNIHNIIGGIELDSEEVAVDIEE